MSYVLRKHGARGRGGYVQPPGSAKSYGGKATARTYPTRADAVADSCGNEYPEEI